MKKYLPVLVGVLLFTPINAEASECSVSNNFSSYQAQVDTNIYYNFDKYLTDSNLKYVIGEKNQYNNSAIVYETINPCMAFATCWGEAGCSEKGVSLTTVMDFQDSTYSESIDWLTVSSNLIQVDSDWYLVHTDEDERNINQDGHAYGLPVTLLQYPRGGDRRTATMTNLGVGPFQVTSSNWDKWDVDDRVNPINGYLASLEKCGTNWLSTDIKYTNDVSVYAAQSLSHQGGGLITYELGKELISLFENEEVLEAFDSVALTMYEDAYYLSNGEGISTSSIDITSYLLEVESLCSIDFSDYDFGPGSTNKGNYVAKHVLRYCFYKYYFSGLEFDTDEYTNED